MHCKILKFLFSCSLHGRVKDDCCRTPANAGLDVCCKPHTVVQYTTHCGLGTGGRNEQCMNFRLPAAATFLSPSLDHRNKGKRKQEQASFGVQGGGARTQDLPLDAIVLNLDVMFSTCRLDRTVTTCTGLHAGAKRLVSVPTLSHKAQGEMQKTVNGNLKLDAVQGKCRKFQEGSLFCTRGFCCCPAHDA